MENGLFHSPGKLETAFLASCIVAVLIMYIISLNIPIFGDAYMYGYRSASWMSNNGLPFVPQGMEKGTQAMGHPSLFFWVWAVLMSLLGDTLAVARLLPAVGTLLALLGTYLLGRDLAGSKWAGFLSAAALLVSPLFLTQAMRPIPDSAMVACVAWSLYYYRSKRYTAAAILCFAGVMFREQAILLAGAYFITELVKSGFRKPGRLALYASPLLVIVVTGLMNLKLNGYFFFPTYMGENTSPLPSGWVISRFRFFAAHLLAEDFRWIAVTTSLAAVLAKTSKKQLPLLSILLLLLPAVLYPPGRILYLIGVIAALGVYIYRKGAIPSGTVIVMIMFPSLLVLFHVFIVFISKEPALDLMRYIIGAYPVIIAGSIALMWKYLGAGSAAIVSCVFLAATAGSNTAAHHYLQPETSLACLRPLLELDEVYSFAASNSDSVIVSDIALDMARNSALGYDVDTRIFRGIDEKYGPLQSGIRYAVIVSTHDASLSTLMHVRNMLPEGSILNEEPLQSWIYGPWKTDCYIVNPSGPDLN